VVWHPCQVQGLVDISTDGALSVSQSFEHISWQMTPTKGPILTCCSNRSGCTFNQASSDQPISEMEGHVTRSCGGTSQNLCLYEVRWTAATGEKQGKSSRQLKTILGLSSPNPAAFRSLTAS
jgi:hypothetical protein